MLAVRPGARHEGFTGSATFAAASAPEPGRPGNQGSVKELAAPMELETGSDDAEGMVAQTSVMLLPCGYCE